MSNKQANEKIEQQEKLQALVLLDSYTNKFEPFSSSHPECLLPFVGGKTLLDNNIEYLIENDVKEIFLFCTRHHKKIKEHIDKRKWNRRVELHFLYNFRCESLGDAMREIDSQGLIRSNFILITATSVITNIKLKEYLEKHAQVAKSDKNTIMTIMCMNKSNDLASTDSTMFENSSTSFVLNNNNKILNYEQLNNNKYINIPIDLIKNAYKSASTQQQAIDNANAKLKHQKSGAQLYMNAAKGLQGDSIELITHLKTVTQRNDLFEAQIYLCSPYVLHIFTDNFDFQTMDGFIRGVLIDEEVSGYTMYVDVFKRKFRTHLSSIFNLNSYYLETMRLMQRADILLDFNQRAMYNQMLDRINVYINKKSNKFGDNLKLERNVYIGSNCKIGDKCELVNCYLADNCILGNNVKISNSIIWSNTTIGDDSIINASIIGNNCRIGKNCKIIENTIFSNDCHVKDNTVMKIRGVFYKKEHSNVSDNKAGSFSVSDDNYLKYNSTVRLSLADDEGDDEIEIDENEEFDSMEHSAYQDDDDDDDNQSVSSEARNAAGDTSKNNHFYIWKFTRSIINKEEEMISPNENDSSIGNKLLRQSQSAADNSDGDDMVGESSEYSTDSSDEDNDNNQKINADYEDDDEDFYEHEEKKPEAKATHHEDSDIFLSETIDSLQRGLKQNLDPDNIILEVNSSKHANNIQIDDLCYYLARALLYLPICYNSNSNKLPSIESVIEFDYLQSIKTQLKKYDPILKNYYTRSRQSQKLFLSSYLDFFIETKLKVKINNVVTSFIDAYYVKLLHYLYNDCDFLNEEVILEWFERLEKVNSEKKDLENLELRKYANKKLEPFIKWLKEAEEDDDEDEDDEDDDE